MNHVIDLKRSKLLTPELRREILKQFKTVGYAHLRGADLVDKKNPVPLLTQVFAESIPYGLGVSDRSPIIDNVYTATRAPFFMGLPLHSETSYSTEYPEVFVFYMYESKMLGGQTTLSNNAELFRIFEKNLSPKWFNQNLSYSRVFMDNHTWNRKINRFAGNTSIRSWQEACNTEDPVEAARFLQEKGMNFEWVEKKRLFKIYDVLPSFRTHPFTGEQVWFNQAYMFMRNPKKLGFMAYLGECLLLGSGEYKYFDCTFEDGSPLPPKDIDFIFDTLNARALPINWQEGDILVIDNMKMCHGRKAYLGLRKNFACMFPYPTQAELDAV